MTAAGGTTTQRFPHAKTLSWALDVVAVIGITAAAALISQRWTGVNSPDSEFYASLALFGSDVADRALDAAYLWTRLGYIIPVRALVTTFDPWLGFEIWRWLLLLLIVGSTYATVRLIAPRALAIVAATLTALSTMVLGFIGNTYLTGTILAATWVLMAVACVAVADRLTARWKWLPALVAGAACGWLLMLNPYALGLGGSIWLGIRVVHCVANSQHRWRALARDLLLLACGAAITAGALLVAGTQVFPGRNWLQTYLEWNSRLDYTVFVGDPLVWQRDIALLVPVIALIAGVASIWASRNSRWAWVSVSIAAANLGFTASFMVLVPGPWLEAQHYVAKLWPGALLAIAIAFAAVVRQPPWGTWGWVVGGIGLAAGVPAMLWAGRWEATLTLRQGLLLAGVAVAAILAAMLVAFLAQRPSPGASSGDTLRQWPQRLTSVIVVIALVVVFTVAQLLQNGRGALGIYRQYPLRAAYVDYQMQQQMASKIALQQWLLDRTAGGDRIGLWTDPDRLTGEVAAMQLWGYYNLISTSPALTRDESTLLESTEPSVIAMYAPTRGQIETFFASLPPWGRPSPLECTSQPFLGIGSEEAWLCITHLRWVG